MNKLVKKYKIVLLAAVSIFIFILIFSASNASAASNKPEFVPQNPNFREDYRFVDKVWDDKRTSYSTHDWIADAALRNVRSGNSDWSWLMNYDVSHDRDCHWVSSYQTVGKHYVSRSYITYLFAPAT